MPDLERTQKFENKKKVKKENNKKRMIKTLRKPETEERKDKNTRKLSLLNVFTIILPFKLIYTTRPLFPFLYPFTPYPPIS